MLQDKLRISTKKLEEYETLFKCQEETTQKLVLEYQARLEEGEERLRRQQEDKDIQMKGIISRCGCPVPALVPAPAPHCPPGGCWAGQGPISCRMHGQEGGECPRWWGQCGTDLGVGGSMESVLEVECRVGPGRSEGSRDQLLEMETAGVTASW